MTIKIVEPNEFFRRKYGKHFSTAKPVTKEKLEKARKIYYMRLKEASSQRRKGMVITIRPRG